MLWAVHSWGNVMHMISIDLYIASQRSSGRWTPYTSALLRCVADCLRYIVDCFVGRVNLFCGFLEGQEQSRGLWGRSEAGRDQEWDGSGGVQHRDRHTASLQTQKRRFSFRIVYLCEQALGKLNLRLISFDPNWFVMIHFCWVIIIIRSWGGCHPTPQCPPSDGLESL